MAHMKYNHGLYFSRISKLCVFIVNMHFWGGKNSLVRNSTAESQKSKSKERLSSLLHISISIERKLVIKLH